MLRVRSTNPRNRLALLKRRRGLPPPPTGRGRNPACGHYAQPMPRFDLTSPTPAQISAPVALSPTALGALRDPLERRAEAAVLALARGRLRSTPYGAGYTVPTLWTAGRRAWRSPDGPPLPRARPASLPRGPSRRSTREEAQAPPGRSGRSRHQDGLTTEEKQGKRPVLDNCCAPRASLDVPLLQPSAWLKTCSTGPVLRQEFVEPLGRVRPHHCAAMRPTASCDSGSAWQKLHAP
jgi:hypothetical protein